MLNRLSRFRNPKREMVASGAELGVSQTLGKSQTSEGVLVHPLPFSEQSVLDSAKNLIIQVSYKIVLKKTKIKQK